MTAKRGQVTIFIIIAVVIVAIGLSVYFFYQEQQKKLTEPEIAKIKTYLKETIDYEVSSCIVLWGLQGGYSEKPLKSLSLQYHFVPYYYFDKKADIPGEEKLKEELAREIAKKLANMSFSYKRVELEPSQARVNVNETIEVGFSVKIEKGETSILLDEKYIYDGMPTKKLLGISSAIVKAVKADPKAINLEAIFDLQKEQNITISPLIYDQTTVIYRLADNQTIILNSPFEFYFAVENV